MKAAACFFVGFVVSFALSFWLTTRRLRRERMKRGAP